jgi:predicted dehydrogenase
MHDQGFNNLEILKIGCMISLGPAYLGDLGIPKCDELKRPTHPTLDMKTSRRKFINKASAAFAGVQFLPSHVWANSPNGKLNLVQIGCGGKGAGDLAQMRSHPKVHIAALCDIDSKILDGVKRKNPDARAFDDYRELFAAMGNKIDGVVVSTPDHTHAPASMLALNLGKHVYCQKPLTHDVYEARQVRLIAEKKGMVTQMGIQIHASKDYRSATQLIQSGVIGKVHHVHAWSNKTWGYDGGPIVGEDPVPENVNWDAWVGTAAMRSYKKGTYHRSQWRKLLDFGCGTLGDMGVHIFDTPFRALELSVPLKVKTTCRKPTGVGHPSKNVVEYEFSGTKHRKNDLEVVRWPLRATKGHQDRRQKASGPRIAVHWRKGADAVASHRSPAVFRYLWCSPKDAIAGLGTNQPLPPVGRCRSREGQGERQLQLCRSTYRSDVVGRCRGSLSRSGTPLG